MEYKVWSQEVGDQQKLLQILEEPAAFDQCFLAFRKANQMSELVQAIEQLPDEPLKYARLGFLKMRLLQFNEAKTAWSKYGDDPYCFFSLFRLEMEGVSAESAKNYIVKMLHFGPIKMTRAIHIEAEAIRCFMIAGSYLECKEFENAEKYHKKALVLFECLGVISVSEVVKYEMVHGAAFRWRHAPSHQAKG